MSPRNSEPSRQRILAAAADIMPEQRFSMDEVARRAGVSKATLYRHYPDRDALSRALVEAGLAAPQAPEADRRSEILEATLRIINRTGFTGLTMAAVAAEAGMAPSALYWYFASKQELLDGTLRHFSVLAQAEDLASLDGPEGDEERLAALGRRLLEIFATHGDVFFKVLLEAQSHPGAAAAIYAGGLGRVMPLLVGYLDRRVAEGAIRPGDNFARAQAFMGMFIMYAFSRKTFGPLLTLEPEAAVATYTDLFWQGIKHHGEEEE